MRRYAVLIFAASTLTGCAEDPSKAVPEAKVQAVEPAVDKAPAQVPASHAVQAPPRDHRVLRSRTDQLYRQ